VRVVKIVYWPKELLESRCRCAGREWVRASSGFRFFFWNSEKKNTRIWVGVAVGRKTRATVECTVAYGFRVWRWGCGRSSAVLLAALPELSPHINVNFHMYCCALSFYCLGFCNSLAHWHTGSRTKFFRSSRVHHVINWMPYSVAKLNQVPTVDQY